EAFLKGRYHLHKETPEGLLKALALFEQATQLDPLYAEAWAVLSQTRLIRSTAHPELEAPARDAARKALELHPDLAEAHLALANIHLTVDWDWKGAQQEYERALELAPGLAMAYHDYAGFLTTLGRSDEAIAQAERGLELDPVAPWVHADTAWCYF